MKLTQSQKTKKHTISNLTESELIILHRALVDSGYEAQKMADKIEQHLIDCEDEDFILEEYGITVKEYIRNVLYPEQKEVESDVATEEVEEDLAVLTAHINKDVLGHNQLSIKAAHQEINLKMTEVTYADLDILIKQLETIRNTLT